LNPFVAARVARKARKIVVIRFVMMLNNTLETSGEQESALTQDDDTDDKVSVEITAAVEITLRITF
jgi:hypothetical protein